MVVIRSNYTKHSWNGGQANEPPTLYDYNKSLHIPHSSACVTTTEWGATDREYFHHPEIFSNTLESLVTKSIMSSPKEYLISKSIASICTYRIAPMPIDYVIKDPSRDVMHPPNPSNRSPFSHLMKSSHLLYRPKRPTRPTLTISFDQPLKGVTNP